ncbi:hypothetical protein [Alicyclobacillus acidoterrestris]|uniref:hypothetical protein n=1 Tax=Alicyclobacillus TaxID=29330 RepID=UPI00389926FD
MSLHRFWYWSRKLRTLNQVERSEEIQWLSVGMGEPSWEDTLIVQVGNVRIEVGQRFNPVLLQQVVQALTHAQ